MRGKKKRKTYRKKRHYKLVWKGSFLILLMVSAITENKGSLYSCVCPTLCDGSLSGAAGQVTLIFLRFPCMTLRPEWVLRMHIPFTVAKHTDLPPSLSRFSAGTAGPISKCADCLLCSILIFSRIVGIFPWTSGGTSGAWGPHFLGLWIFLHLALQWVINDPVNVHSTANHKVQSGRWTL